MLPPLVVKPGLTTAAASSVAEPLVLVVPGWPWDAAQPVAAMEISTASASTLDGYFMVLLKRCV